MRKVFERIFGRKLLSDDTAMVQHSRYASFECSCDGMASHFHCSSCGVHLPRRGPCRDCIETLRWGSPELAKRARSAADSEVAAWPLLSFCVFCRTRTGHSITGLPINTVLPKAFDGAVNHFLERHRASSEVEAIRWLIYNWAITGSGSREFSCKLIENTLRHINTPNEVVGKVSDAIVAKLPQKVLDGHPPPGLRVGPAEMRDAWLSRYSATSLKSI